MSGIKFNCPECRSSLEVDESGAGMTVECPQCSKQIQIPSATPAAAPQNERWYYAASGQQLGPISQELVVQKVKDGEITVATLLWKEGMTSWTPAGQTFLSEFFRKTVPPPLPPSACPNTMAAAEQTEFSVVLTATGNDEIRVIKEIRAITGLSLKESYDLVKGMPKTVKEGITKEDAAKIKDQLQRAGAKVVVKGSACQSETSVPANDETIRCSRCGSSTVEWDKTKFGMGKAVAGAILLGPLGAFAGLAGKKKIVFTCLKCGNTWKPGD